MNPITRTGVALLAACLVLSCAGCNTKTNTEEEPAVSESLSTTEITKSVTTAEASATAQTAVQAETTTTKKAVVTATTAEPAPEETQAEPAGEAQAETTTTTAETHQQTLADQKAYQAYQEAVENACSVNAINAQIDLKLSGNDSSETFNFLASGNFMATLKNSKLDAASADFNISLQGEQEDCLFYYTNSALYSNSGGKKSKITISGSGLDTIFSDDDFKANPGLFNESDFFDTSTETKDEITTTTVTINKEKMENMLSECENDLNINAAQGQESLPNFKLVFSINENKYLTYLSLSCVSNDSSETFDIEFSMSLTYPENLNIVIPNDLDEYPESTDFNLSSM